MTTSPLAAYPGEPIQPAALPLPPDLPELPPNPRVLQLTDGDCVARGLVEGTGRRHASDHEVRSCLDLVLATATLLDPHAQARCTVSSATALRHFEVLTSARNNSFTINRGLDWADWALLDELAALIDARTMAARPGRKRPARLASLVILVAQDEIYAQPVRQLRLLGIPCWLLVPGRSAAASLRTASCAVSYIGPRRTA